MNDKASKQFRHEADERLSVETINPFAVGLKANLLCKLAVNSNGFAFNFGRRKHNGKNEGERATENR